jgi:hypothetical protein
MLDCVLHSKIQTLPHKDTVLLQDLPVQHDLQDVVSYNQKYHMKYQTCMVSMQDQPVQDAQVDEGQCNQIAYTLHHKNTVLQAEPIQGGVSFCN